jgi:hypothetical protein
MTLVAVALLAVARRRFPQVALETA